jgi:solute carrier family 12 (potassium/chloride transporters), member 9
MKPNTVCLGFYDDTPKHDTLSPTMVTTVRNRRSDHPALAQILQQFPDPSSQQDERRLNAVEYVGLVSDALRMNKNVVLFRHFGHFNKQQSVLGATRNRPAYIDVWPVDLLKPPTTLATSQFDSTCLFMLQLACILHMVPGWKKNTKLRIFTCLRLGESPMDVDNKRRMLMQYLTALRIRGKVHVVPYEDWSRQVDECSFLASDCQVPSAEQLRKINGMICEQCTDNTAVVFLYLPKPPMHTGQQQLYLQSLELMTKDLPPTVLVHGLHPVTSTTL